MYNLSSILISTVLLSDLVLALCCCLIAPIIEWKTCTKNELIIVDKNIYFMPHAQCLGFLLGYTKFVLYATFGNCMGRFIVSVP